MTEENKDRQFLEHSIRMMKSRIRLADFGAALMLMLSVGLLMIFIAVIFDHSTPGGLGRQTRNIIRLALAGSEIILAAWLLFLPLTKRITDQYVAKAIEKTYPAFKNELTAAVEFSSEENFSPETMDALQKRAARRLSSIHPTISINLTGIYVASIILSCVFLVILGYCLFTPLSFIDSMARVMGNDAIPVPSSIEMRIIKPDTEKAYSTGEKIRFEAGVTHPKGKVILKISRNQDKSFLPEDTIVMSEIPGENRERKFKAAWKTPPVDTDAFFHVVCGNARTDTLKLAIRRPPEIEKISASCTWPDYTGTGIKEHRTPNIRAPLQSTVTISAITNHSLQDAMVVFKSDRESVPMTIGNNTMSCRFTLLQDDKYHVRFSNSEKNRWYSSPDYEMEVIPDLKPSVAIGKPEKSKLKLSLDSTLHISGSANDESFGIRQIEMVIAKGKRETIFPVAGFPAPGKTIVPFDMKTAVSDIGNVGDVVTCFVRAFDHCRTKTNSEGQVGYSRGIVIDITKPR